MSQSMLVKIFQSPHNYSIIRTICLIAAKVQHQQRWGRGSESWDRHLSVFWRLVMPSSPPMTAHSANSSDLRSRWVGSKNVLQALDSHPVNLYVNTLPIDNSVLKPNTPR